MKNQYKVVVVIKGKKYEYVVEASCGGEALSIGEGMAREAFLKTVPAFEISRASVTAVKDEAKPKVKK